MGLALAQWGSGAAWADSAVGVDTVLGNAANPPGRANVPRARDSTDMTVHRTPSGQLYSYPFDLPDEPSKTSGGWEYRADAEVGAVAGDGKAKNALFRKYKDTPNGPVLNYLEVEAERPDTANFLQFNLSDPSLRDQFLGLQFGRYNDWKVKLFYNETQHVFTDNWKSLYSGEGTGELTLNGAGLALPTPVKSGTPVVGTGACTALAPCWKYNGTVYSNASSLAAINGQAGTYSAAGTLVAGSPQSNLSAAIATKLANTPEGELALIRKKGGARLDTNLSERWKGYASYSMEKRTGARPFAMNEGNISSEIAEPIDYDTHEFLLGLQYADALTQANLRATGSIFRNNISTLNVQYPLLSSAAANGVVQSATFDLYPDNDAYSLKGEVARKFPEFYKARLTAVVSMGSNRQNAALLAPISDVQSAQFAAAGYTTLSGTSAGYATNSALVSNWNTVNALSRQTSGQRIDNKLVDVGLSMAPTDALSLKASLRSYQNDNKGGYVAYNPLTGQFGRGFAEGNGLTNLDVVVGLQPGAATNSLGSCYAPAGVTVVDACKFGYSATATPAIAGGANVPVFGQARSTRQTNLVLSADYDLGNTSSLNAALEQEEFTRNFRERDKTWETKLKLGYVNRALGDSTLRLSYEAGDKRGSDYRFRTFEDLGTGLPGLDVATQTSMAGTNGYAVLAANLYNRYSYYFRKYDQADRDQSVFNARWNYQASNQLDLGLFLQARNVKYPDSFYGLEQDNQHSVSLDANYQTEQATLYGYYSYQQADKKMALNSGVAVGATTTNCTVANLTLYGPSACADSVVVNGVDTGTRPATSAWSSRNRDQNDVLGLGYQRRMGQVMFGLDYSYARGVTNVSYDYGSTALSAVAATQATMAAVAGNALPSMSFVQQSVSASLLVPLSKRVTLRVFDRYELGKIADWHYDQVLTGVVNVFDSGTLQLDAGPQNYHTNIVGVVLQVKL
jgi:hypothetical protein